MRVTVPKSDRGLDCDLSQPPYPVIPATELPGNLLLDFNRPVEAAPYFQKTLQRTPNRPKDIFGLARAAVARDVQDPELKWDLEKLGGAVALGTLRRTRDECESALAALLKWDLEKLGAGTRGTFRRTTEERGAALASMVEELRTA